MISYFLYKMFIIFEGVLLLAAVQFAEDFVLVVQKPVNVRHRSQRCRAADIWDPSRELLVGQRLLRHISCLRYSNVYVVFICLNIGCMLAWHDCTKVKVCD